MYRTSYILAGYASLMAMAVLAKASEGASLPSNEKAIKEAIAKLDTKNDKHWNADGSPNLDAIRMVMKNSEITQIDLNSAADGATRPSGARKTQSAKQLAKREEDALPADLVDEETGRFNLENEDGTRRKVFVRNREVAAFERGFASGAIRDPGDKFIYTGELGSWMMDPEHENRARIAAEEAEARVKRMKPDPVKADA